MTSRRLHNKNYKVTRILARISEIPGVCMEIIYPRAISRCTCDGIIALNVNITMISNSLMNLMMNSVIFAGVVNELTANYYSIGAAVTMECSLGVGSDRSVPSSTQWLGTSRDQRSCRTIE